MVRRRERDATLSRLILKFCTRDPAINQKKKEANAIICLVYEKEQYGSITLIAGECYQANTTRTVEMKRYIFSGEKKCGHKQSLAKLRKPVLIPIPIK